MVVHRLSLAGGRNRDLEHAHQRVLEDHFVTLRCNRYRIKALREAGLVLCGCMDLPSHRRQECECRKRPVRPPPPTSRTTLCLHAASQTARAGCGYFRGIYRSVSVPSNASAALATVSLSVGCGWMVSPMSAASQPVSIASATSLISSPALVPTMPPPSTR